MTTYNTDGKVGSWAGEKLECLAKYLNAYTTILKEKSWCQGYYYVDAFAGAGRARIRTNPVAGKPEKTDLFGYVPETEAEQQYLDGSPRVALGIKHPFSAYLFIERDRTRLQELETLTAEFPDKNIRIRPGDANEILKTRLVSNPRIDWTRSRAVVFLDPFGMQVDWETLRCLAQTKAIEVIVNFPVGMAIQRLLEKTGSITRARTARLNQYFGTDEWKGVVYESRADFFGQETEKVSGSGDKLARWYSDRLRTEFGYTAVPRLIRNTRGAHLYYLIWAGPNATGRKIAAAVLAQGNRIRTIRH